MFRVYATVCMFSMLCATNSIHGELYQSISSFFGGKPYEAIVEKDYTIDNQGRITIKNIHGNITVKTGLDKKSIAIRAIKHASAQEHLDHMHIIEEEVKPDQLSLRTAYDYEKVKGTVDYVVTIPDDASIHISTDTGDISIQQVHGTITAITGTGNILAEQPTNKTQATITQQGNVSIVQPKGPVLAKNNKGNVHIRESMHSVGAQVKQGKIELKCRQLDPQQQIKCTIDNGPIFVHLPKQMNCSLTADTQNGTIMSERPIKLNAETTTLDNNYWSRVKKQVRGSIGKPEAMITLRADQGNIKISGA